MALEIIGSGFGRTGTMTMKHALETLGFGPTHHMTEIIGKPDQLAHWKAVFAGTPVDWTEVFDGYRAQVDWPGAARWEQISIAFPDAKIIHTERPEEDWWASFDKTIGKFYATMDDLPLPPIVREIFTVMRDGLLAEAMSDFTDKSTAIAAYRDNNQRVRETVPEDRLLVFDVADGWAPLCRFLDQPVPVTPFPESNARKEFWERYGGEPAGPTATG